MLRKKDMVPLLFLLLAVLFFFGDLLWTDRTFFTSDLLTQAHPWRTFTADRLKEGQAPLWDPSPYCGMPHAAKAPSRASSNASRGTKGRAEAAISTTAFLAAW